jgi:nitroreductase
VKKATPSYETQGLREFGEVLRGRRTIELFLQTPVPDALIQEAIEVATWAPNHHVTEPWKFYLLGNEAIEKCLDLCRDIVAAKKDARVAEFKAKSWSEKPGWLVVSCRKSEDELTQQEDYGAVESRRRIKVDVWRYYSGCAFLRHHRCECRGGIRRWPDLARLPEAHPDTNSQRPRRGCSRADLVSRQFVLVMNERGWCDKRSQ